MKRAVLYDFHGTLVNVTSIRHLVAARAYDAFYAGSLLCPPIEATVMAARHSAEAGYRNLLFTGMPDSYSDGLVDWLTRHGVPMGPISMRVTGDYRKDFVVKREMYLAALEEGYQIIRAWDDNPRCLELWTHQGIPTVPVPGWDETLTTQQVDRPTAAP